jgi:macrolide transport system ATP-binding/permease protein
MRSLRALVVRFTTLFDRSRGDREFAAEMDSHLALHVDDNVRAGMTPAEARRQAIIALGGVEQTRERLRERRGLPTVESVLGDVRHSLRQFPSEKMAVVAPIPSASVSTATAVKVRLWSASA